jgi:hypothetical protein
MLLDVLLDAIRAHKKSLTIYSLSCVLLLTVTDSVQLLAFSSQPSSPSPSILQLGHIVGVTTNGTINSVIRTPSTNWIATGQWELGVNNGTIALFTTNMTWYNSNGTGVHTHEFRNFRSFGGQQQPITILPNRTLFLSGVMDVGTNNHLVWKNVQSTISIRGGKTILITVNDAQTNQHFAGQPIFGIVTSFTPCSDVPLPNMEVLPSCISVISSSPTPSLSPSSSNATAITNATTGGGLQQQLQNSTSNNSSKTTTTITNNPNTSINQGVPQTLTNKSNTTGNATITTTNATNTTSSLNMNKNNSPPPPTKSPFDILGGG